MNDNKDLNNFSVGNNSNGVSGSNTYKFHNISSTPMVYIGNNPSVAAAVEKAEAERTGSFDPYTLASNKAYSVAYSQAPKVGISNGKITVSAPQSILDSPYYQQLNQELQSLKGADLSSPAVQEAVDRLNDEIQTNFQEVAVKNTLGWTPEELNDYQYTIQTVRGTTPLRSNNVVKGKDKEGNVVSKTPKDWVEYWREIYNTDERVDAFLKSAQSKDPYGRTMYLVMSQGGGTPVYGFDPLEKLGQGFGALMNQMKKFPEGALRLISTDSNTRAIEDRSKALNISPDTLIKLSSITDEDMFNKMRDSIRGKKWSELSDEQKAFVLELGVSKQDSSMLNNRANREITKGLPLPGGAYEQALDDMSSDNETNSRLGIDNILDDSSYDKFKTTRDNYNTWQNYDQDVSQDDERLAKNAIMSPTEQTVGNITGSIGRFLWEAAVARGVTGGKVNINAISDTIGEKIVNSLAKHGLSPASRIGQNVLSFTANLAGTIPEDILQTALDNVLTYNIDDNKHILDFDQMSDNFKSNLIVMSLFNAAKSGLNAVKRARIAKQLAQQADMNQVVNIEGLNPDVDDLSRAIKNGNDIKVENEKVSVVDENGNEKVLENITPEQSEMILSNFETERMQSKLSDVDYLIKSAEKELESISGSEYDNPVFENSRQELSEYIQELKQQRADIVSELESATKTTENIDGTDASVIRRTLDNADLDIAPWHSKELRADWDGQVNTLRQYIAQNSPIDLKTGNESHIDGSIAWWLNDGASKFDHGVELNKRWESLPTEVREKIADGDGTFSKIVGRSGLETAFMRLGIDNVYDPDIIDRIYADYLWKQAHPTADSTTAAPTATEANVQASIKDINEDVVDNKIKLVDEDAKAKDVEVKAPETETPKVEAETLKSEAKTPKSETPKVDYGYIPLNDALDINIRPDQAELRDWHNQTHNRIMNDFDNNFINKFHNKFGDVQASDFDWVWYQSKQGKAPAEIVGTTDPTTGRVITQNMIGAMEWWAEQPQTKALRRASRDALGLEGDFNVLGYLPHTDYDPRYSSFEEAMSGALWQTSTGASVMDEGQYKGYGGDFRSRYDTFVSNMLWDARAKDVATAKLLDEVRMDGQEITPEVETNARRAVDGEKNIQKLVNNADSTKAVVKALESVTEDTDEIDWKKIDEDTKKQAEKSGLGQAIHDNYNRVYYGANSKNVSKQSGVVANNFDTLGNTMKNTVIEGAGSLYDNGGADLVYAPQNAIDIVNRYMREGGDLREMLQEYVENHSHRSPEYAEEVVDKWMGKLGEIQGPLTKAKVIQTLGNSMKWEAMTRLKRWLALAKYDQFNASTRKTIDRFLFNHMQMDAIKYNPTIRQRLTKGLNDLTALRYRALFYGNIKNALLQVSELNRYFSSFKWGDVATMAKRLATDEGFRARVDDYVQSVAPMTSQLKADIYQSYSDIADSMKVEKDGVTFKDLGNKAKTTADTIGLAPIEAAEAFKNRMMVAGLVQEADRLGLTGDEALRHIRNRFERVALAADEMGKIGMASNPLAKTMLFLQNFQIRELGMHLYNIKDATGMAKSMPGKVLAATNYLTKVFGAKLATTLILARLGYSASQTMGIDPFGLLDQYNDLDREDMELPDFFFMSPLFSGGMTSLISDMYFMARKAYEDSNQETVSEEAEQRLAPSWGVAWPDISFDNVMEAAANFIPGSVFANRIGQTNEMMDTGWATSATGNKMYTAPEDALNTVLGYLFGRSATQNAQQYRQTYGDNLWQTLGRFARQMNPFSDYNRDSFDPIDTKNYTDWFKGDANDRQQFEKGRRYFQSERDRIIDTYESVVSKSYASDEELAEAKNNMNAKLEELYDKLERFVDAYEKKNGTIDASMVKQVINLLNTGRKAMGDTAEEAEQRSLDDYNKALGRYSSLGLSPVGTYSGATAREPEKETKYQGSPQWRTSSQYAKYGAPAEAVNVLKEADKLLQPIRKEITDAISAAYDRKDYDEVERIQRGYLDEFDNVVSPIIAAYGNGIFGSTDVVNQIKDMLSTGTNSRSGNLIPSDDYRKDKYGRYRSMPFETVDVKKWAQQRFRGDLYKNPTASGSSNVKDDIDEIKKLSNNGQKGRAIAKALQLKVRVDNQTRSLSKDQYNWLNNFIKGDK